MELPGTRLMYRCPEDHRPSTSSKDLKHECHMGPRVCCPASRLLMPPQKISPHACSIAKACAGEPACKASWSCCSTAVQAFRVLWSFEASRFNVPSVWLPQRFLRPLQIWFLGLLRASHRKRFELHSLPVYFQQGSYLYNFLCCNKTGMFQDGCRPSASNILNVTCH